MIYIFRRKYVDEFLEVTLNNCAFFVSENVLTVIAIKAISLRSMTTTRSLIFSRYYTTYSVTKVLQKTTKQIFFVAKHPNTAAASPFGWFLQQFFEVICNDVLL